MSLGSTIGNAYLAIKPKADKSFSKDLEGMGGEAGGLAGTLFNGKFGAALTKLPGILKGLGISVSLGKFIKDSIDVGKAFDQSMSQVAATMGNVDDMSADVFENLKKNAKEMGIAFDEATTPTELSFQTLRQFAQEMGATTMFSAQQASEALNYMALAGYDANTSMEMLPTVLDLAAAGNMELARASDMVTDAQSALGLSTEQTALMVDQMAKTSSKTNTSVEQLGDAFLTVGGTAKVMKGGTAELSQVLGLLADNGIKGTEGGTALRNMLLTLSAPTDQAAQQMKELGLEVFDSSGNMRSMQDIMQDLNASMADMTDEQRTQAIANMFNTRDLKAVNALLGTSAERWDEVATAIDGAAGAAHEMAETQMDNLAGDATYLKSALEGLQIKVSDVVTPALRSLTQFATGALGGITGFFDAHKDVFDGLTKLLSGGLSVALGIVQRGFDALGAVLGAVFNVLKPILPVINAFIDVLGYAFDAINAFVSPVKELFSGLGDSTTSIFDNMTEVISKDMEVASEAGKAAVDGLVAFMSGDFETAHEKAKEAFDLIKGLIQEKLEAAKEIVIGIADKIGEKLGFPGLGDKVRVLFMALEKFIEDPVGTAKEFVHTAIEKIKSMFNFQWSLPHLKLPHIVVGSYIDVPVLGRIPNPTTLHVEWYKKGGIVDSPTLFGAGEAGPEAIVPLTAPNVIPFAEAVADRIDAYGDTFVFNITADSETTLQSLVREAQRARMQYA